MTSKCGKNKKSGTRGVAECVTDVLTTFWRLLWSISESDARQHAIYLFYIITTSLSYLKIFQHNAKAGLLPRLCFARKKKPFDVIYLFKMKQFHWLLCVVSLVVKNCDWSRKNAPLSNLTRAPKKYPRKTYGCGQPRGHLIWVLNERSVNDGGDFLSSVVGDSQISFIYVDDSLLNATLAG